MNILIKFPTRSRPEQFKAALENIFETVTDAEKVKVLVSIDRDDITMYNREMIQYLNSYMAEEKVFLYVGKSENKIDAINRDINKEDWNWDILFVFSDDMKFEIAGWDTVVRDMMQMHYPDLDGCLHFNDGYQGEKLCTIAIMGRKYYDREKRVYNTIYKSVYPDDEWTAIAKQRNKIIYFPVVICKQSHPANTGAAWDDLLKRNQSYELQDLQTFNKRKLQNFK